MERLSHWVAWIVVALIVVFAGLNWPALNATTALNFGFMQVQAPLGLVLLGMTAVFVALFFFATLTSRVVGLMELRRLHNELRDARQLADRADVSRIDALQQTMLSEFRLVGEQLNRIEPSRGSGITAAPTIVASPVDRFGP